jgi:hypothetical protein
MTNFEKTTYKYYSDSPKLQKKAAAAGKYIDMHGMSKTGLIFWLKFFDWWNFDHSHENPDRMKQYYNQNNPLLSETSDVNF